MLENSPQRGESSDRTHKREVEKVNVRNSHVPFFCLFFFVSLLRVSSYRFVYILLFFQFRFGRNKKYKLTVAHIFRNEHEEKCEIVEECMRRKRSTISRHISLYAVCVMRQYHFFTFFHCVCVSANVCVCALIVCISRIVIVIISDFLYQFRKMVSSNLASLSFALQVKWLNLNFSLRE